MKTERGVNFGKTLIFVVLFAAFFSVGCTSAATTYTICPSGCNHTSIQVAIGAAEQGDTIEVHSGTYYENVDVNKTLILKGVDTGTGKPVVDAGGSGNAITLSAHGITLEGFRATNSGRGDAGIEVTSNNNTITGNTATHNEEGIFLYDSRNNSITNNTVNNNNYYGTYLSRSCGNTLRDNLMSNNRYNFGVWAHFNNDIDTSNLVDDKPIYYLVGASGTVIDSSTNAGTVYCINCDSVTVKDLALTNNSKGICFYNTWNSIIQNNHISNNGGGIYLYSSCNNNTISGNNVSSNNGDGIYLYSSCNDNTISGNTASNNGGVYPLHFFYGTGIYIWSSSNNNITGNDASNNGDDGIKLYSYSNNNTVTGNNVSNNYYGIYLPSSSNKNTITDNNVSNNSNGISVYSCNNTITGNNANNNRYGISLGSSGGNTLRDNLMSNNRYNFEGGSGYNDIDTSNLVDGKPIYYLVGTSGSVIDSSSNAGTVYCINCGCITVKDLTFTNNSNGIFFYNTNNSSVQNNHISNNRHGIHLDHSNNNTLSGNNANNNSFGIDLRYSSNNNTITGNTATNNWYGIHLFSSSNNTLSGNSANNNRYGISLLFSSSNTLRDNLMSNNRNNFKVLGNCYSDFNNDIDTSNLVGGKPIYYLVGASGTVIDSSSNAGTVYCINCDSVTVKDMTLTNNSNGIYFYNTRDSSIQNNHINNGCGIHLDHSSNNTISGNNANNKRGISLYYSSYNTILDNTASNNSDGIRLDHSSNNTVSGNNANNSYNGIYLRSSSNNNIITGNTATNNGYGISLLFSSSNTLRDNLMSNNRNNFKVLGNCYSDFNNDIDTSNLVDGKPIYYLVGASGTIIDSSTNAGTVYCINCDRITVNDLTLTNNSNGICFYNTGNSSIQNNHISNNGDHSIFFYYSNNNKIYLNNFVNNADNVYSYKSSNIWNSTEPIAYQYNDIEYTNYLGNYWADYSGNDTDGDGIGDSPYSIRDNYALGEDKDNHPLMQPWENYFAPAPSVFDTGAGTYPSIMGTHNGTITPSCNITANKLYTYPCAGTGGHTKSIELYENGTLIANGTWNGYHEEWQNITISPLVILQVGHIYNYTIVTGSYPQILHTTSKEVTGGTITCTSFVDANGKIYTDRIPAIKFF